MNRSQVGQLHISCQHGIPFHVARIKITNRVQLCTDLLLAIIISFSCGHKINAEEEELIFYAHPTLDGCVPKGYLR